MQSKCYVKCNVVICISAPFTTEKKIVFPTLKKRAICTGKRHNKSSFIQGYYFTDNYRFSLPVGSFIVLTSPTRTTAQTRVGKWQTRVVRYSNEPVRNFSDPIISRATATEHNRLSALYPSRRELLHSIPCYTSQGWRPLATPSRKQSTAN
jgi:hypothetical protein